MEAFLTEEVGLKPDAATQVAKYCDETFDIESSDDLKHLVKDDIEDIIAKTELKKVAAGKLLGAWERLKAAAEPLPPAPATAPLEGSDSPIKARGFLPGYSDADGGSGASALRLMFLSEEGAAGKRELIVDHDKTSNFFEAMYGDALLITVFGPARCGKSFLMNLLSGHKDLFEVAHGNLPCTQGVFISQQHEDGAKFRRRADTMAVASAAARGEEAAHIEAVGKAYASSATVSYVDVEGLGDKGKAYDVHLIAPLLLVSKILMYNWKGAPNKHVMLESLLTLGEAAQRVHVGDRAADGAKPIFGHLVVLLRDWHTTDNVYELLFGAEPDKGDDAVKARNRARALVVGAFESITIRCLPFPGLDPSDSSMAQLSQHFVDEYLALREDLVGLSSTPEPSKLFNDRPLDGPTVSTLLPLLAGKLNSDEDLLPREVWRLMEEHRLNKVLDEFKGEVQAWVAEREASGALPATRSKCADLGTALVAFGAEGQLRQLDGLGWLSSETRAAAKAGYEAYLADQAQLLAAKNERALAELKARLDAAVAAAEGGLRAAIGAELEPTLPEADAAALSAGLARLQAVAWERLAAGEAELAAACEAVLEASLAEAFAAAAERLNAATLASNKDMLARAESVLLRCVAVLREGLHALRRASEASPMPEASVAAQADALRATARGEVTAGLAFVAGECRGRAGFAGEQAAEADRLASADAAEVAAAWPRHRAHHLEAAASAGLAGFRAALAEAEAALPVSTGELELQMGARLKAAHAALDAAATALGLSTGNAAVSGCRADLDGRLDAALKGLRAKNGELLRKAAPPEPPAFGKLQGADRAVGALVLVPQPGPRFSCPADAVELERKPCSSDAPALAEVGHGAPSVEIATGGGLTNGKPYTFRVRARNANGWGAWSPPSTCVPFGRPPSPAVAPGGAQAGDRQVIFTLDPSRGDNGAPISAYRVSYTAKKDRAAGVATVPTDPGAPFVVACPPELVNGAAYDFTLCAINAGGTSEPSAPVTCSPAPPPPAPRIQRVVPMDAALQVALHADSLPDPLAAADDAPGAASAATSFEVTFRVLGKYAYGAPETRAFPASAVNTYILRGLTNGASYNVTVVGVNGVGKSPPSGVVVATPNTRWGTVKKVLNFCGGPSASSGAVLEQPDKEDEEGGGAGGGSRGGARPNAASVAFDLGDVYR